MEILRKIKSLYSVLFGRETGKGFELELAEDIKMHCIFYKLLCVYEVMRVVTLMFVCFLCLAVRFSRIKNNRCECELLKCIIPSGLPACVFELKKF